ASSLDQVAIETAVPLVRSASDCSWRHNNSDACTVSSFGLAMDQQHDLLSSSANSHTAHYNSGDTMATSLSGMTINDHHHGNQFHNENGIAVGLVRPGDCPMKGELAYVGKQVGCVTASQNKYTHILIN
ncbi:hypothetical protein cypCar_00016971, partial [Cyprinus carpio]